MKSKKPEPFFILWSPSGKTPPTRVFKTEKEAREVAGHMANKHYPDGFFVMQSVTNVRAIKNLAWDLPTE